MNSFKTFAYLCILQAAMLGNLAAQDKYIGTITWYGFNFCPRGEALAAGQLISIAQNTALFSLLGTYYGGDGRTTFALPDLRGRFSMGVDQGPGLTNRVLGEVSGTETQTLLINNMPAHNHSLVVSSTRAITTTNTNKVLAKTGAYTGKVDTLTTLSSQSIGITGGSQPFSIMPPYLVLTPCIATEGIFPSRN